MNDEHNEQQDEQPISEISVPLPEQEKLPVMEETTTIPPNLDLGEGYLLSDEPVIEAPPVEDRATGGIDNLLDRIKSKVDIGAKEPREKVKVTKKKQSEFMDLSRMVLSPLLILAVSKYLGDVCKPLPEEADEFIDYASRMITRHVPIPDHMSADLIDMLGMASVGVVWYTRVSGNLPWDSDSGNDDKPPERKPSPSDDGREREGLTEEERLQEVVTGSSIEDFIS